MHHVEVAGMHQGFRYFLFMCVYALWDLCRVIFIPKVYIEDWMWWSGRHFYYNPNWGSMHDSGVPCQNPAPVIWPCWVTMLLYANIRELSLAVYTVPLLPLLCWLSTAADAALQSSLSSLAVIGKAGRHYRCSAKSLVYNGVHICHAI